MSVDLGECPSTQHPIEYRPGRPLEPGFTLLDSTLLGVIPVRALTELQKGPATPLKAPGSTRTGPHRKRPCIFLIIGPSGAGKTTAIEHVLATFSTVHQPKGVWTREPRRTETDPDSRTISHEQMAAKRARGELIAYGESYGNAYASERSAYTDILDRGEHCIRPMTQDGADAIYREMAGYRIVSIFIDCPIGTLRKRLTERGTDPPELIDRRLSNAALERRRRDDWDYKIDGSKPKTAVAERVEQIIRSNI